jgi:hypothetical protein
VKTVLIIDPDLGFVFWLGQMLLAAGYDALPAKGVPEATALLAELGVAVDLLIVNPALAGAPHFVEELRRSKGDLKVLVLASDKGGQAHAIRRPDAILRKPVETDEVTGTVWLRSVEHLLGPKCTHRVAG